MGKTILTPTQSFVLRQIEKNERINSSFFLTGGTALAEFYFKHRLSEDLDFFSEDDLPLDELENFSFLLAKKIKAHIEKKVRSGFIRYTFIGQFGELKIDFVDLYFCLKEQEPSYDQLLKALEEKYPSSPD